MEVDFDYGTGTSELARHRRPSVEVDAVPLDKFGAAAVCAYP